MGVWTALAWVVGAAYSLTFLVRLPGEASGGYTGWQLHLHSMVNLSAGTVSVLLGSALLRRRPPAALGLLLLGSVFAALALSSTEIQFPTFLPADIALWSIAAGRPRRESTVAAAMTTAVLVGLPAVRLWLGFVIGTSTLLAVALTAVVAWLLGNLSRQAHEHQAAERALERAHAAESAVAAERLRIARELHDMVAHTLGIVALQAGAARRVLTTQPEAARDALGEVEAAGRETLSGLRRMLVALRAADGPPDATRSETGLGPLPGLADLDRLARNTTAAGVRVEVHWSGHRRPLPAEVDLAAYRIVEESVTNVVRHADTRSCLILVDCGERELAVEIQDPGELDAAGPPRAREGTGEREGVGYGLLGMRERVDLLGGHFTAGPRPSGGFRVAARLPIPTGAP